MTDPEIEITADLVHDPLQEQHGPHRRGAAPARVSVRPPESGPLVERIVSLGRREVVFRADEAVADALDALVARLSDDGVDAVEGGEVDLGWDSIRFDDRDGVLIATTKDGHTTRGRVRRDDVTQLLWTLSAWDRVARLSGLEAPVPTRWRDWLYVTVGIFKTDRVLECRRDHTDGSTLWFIGGEPFDEDLVDRLAGDIAQCVELFALRPEAAAVLGLPLGYVGVIEKERGVVEVRDPQGAVLFSER
ncbi:hypothetical protein ABZY68_29345 [Streptomyces sp. NPDC006482]|uniref:hypothetical protein n=1 Tax=Streptomyces sp. NPDC006482 TaxID=3154306 RepID=UPI0033B2EBC3